MIALAGRADYDAMGWLSVTRTYLCAEHASGSLVWLDGGIGRLQVTDSLVPCPVIAGPRATNPPPNSPD